MRLPTAGMLDYARQERYHFRRTVLEIAVALSPLAFLVLLNLIVWSNH